MDSLFVPMESWIISPKLTGLLWTTVNTDNVHFLCPELQILVYRKPCFMDTGYLRTVYFHCHIPVLNVDNVPS